MPTNKADQLGDKRISRLLWKFALPAIISLVFHAFYNVVDRIFIGKGVGTSGLAGVTLSFPLMLIMFSFCLLIGAGSGSLLSIRLGEKNIGAAKKILGNMFLLITVFGILLSLSGNLLAEPLLRFFRTSQDTMDMALAYTRPLLTFSPAFFLGFCLNFVIRAEGSPIYATAMIVTGTILNFILDPIFIFVLKMGTAGAAFATVISETSIAFMGLYFIIFKSPLKPLIKDMVPDLKLISRILTMGIPPALMCVIAAVQNGALNAYLQKYGSDISVAAMGIVFCLFSFINMFNFGLGDGMQPIIGYNYGARRLKRVRTTLIRCASIAVGVSALLIAIINIFVHPLVNLFTRGDQELMTQGITGIRIFLLMFPFAALQIIGSRYFQAVEKPVLSAFLAFTRQIIFFIPFLLIFSFKMGLTGVWLSGPAADLCSGLVSFLLLRKEIHVLTRQTAQA